MTTKPRGATLLSTCGLPTYAAYGIYFLYNDHVSGFSPWQPKFLVVASLSWLFIAALLHGRASWYQLAIRLTRRHPRHARSFEFTVLFGALVGLSLINVGAYGPQLLGTEDVAGSFLLVSLLVVVSALAGLNMYPSNVPNSTRGLRRLFSVTLELLKLTIQFVVAVFGVVFPIMIALGQQVGQRLLGLQAGDVPFLAYLLLGALLAVATLTGRLIDLLHDLDAREGAEREADT